MQYHVLRVQGKPSEVSTLYAIMRDQLTDGGARRHSHEGAFPYSREPGSPLKPLLTIPGIEISCVPFLLKKRDKSILGIWHYQRAGEIARLVQIVGDNGFHTLLEQKISEHNLRANHSEDITDDARPSIWRLYYSLSKYFSRKITGFQEVDLLTYQIPPGLGVNPERSEKTAALQEMLQENLKLFYQTTGTLHLVYLLNSEDNGDEYHGFYRVRVYPFQETRIEICPDLFDSLSAEETMGIVSSFLAYAKTRLKELRENGSLGQSFFNPGSAFDSSQYRILAQTLSVVVEKNPEQI